MRDLCTLPDGRCRDTAVILGITGKRFTCFLLADAQLDIRPIFSYDKQTLADPGYCL